MTWARRIGVVVVWTSLQSLFLVPKGFRFAPFQPLIPPTVGVLVNLAVAAAFLWWWAWRPAARGDRRRLATYRVRGAGRAWRWVPVVVAAIMGLTPTGLIVSARVLTLPRNREQVIEQYARVPGGSLSLLVAIAVVAPLLEEFLFRGWVQHSLERHFGRTLGDRRRAGWRAIAVASALFAAVHFEAFGFPLRLTLAVASGYAAWTTRSIWPSVVFHGSYNAWVMMLGAVLPVESIDDLGKLAARPEVLWPSALGFVGSALLLVWALRSMAASRARPAGAAAPDAVTPPAAPEPRASIPG